MKKAITISILNIFLVLICLTTTVFAWFAMNDKVETSGMQISVGLDNVSFDYTIYQYDYDTNTYTDEGNLALRPYDTIIISRNTNTAIIVKLMITGEVINTHDDIIVNFLCSDTQLNTMSLSNVLEFKAALLDITDQSSAQSIYTTAASQFLDKQAKTFYGQQKLTQLSFVFSYSEYGSHINADQMLPLYIEIDYSETLIGNINTTVDATTFNTIITFNADVYELNLEVDD